MGNELLKRLSAELAIREAQMATTARWRFVPTVMARIKNR